MQAMTGGVRKFSEEGINFFYNLPFLVLIECRVNNLIYCFAPVSDLPSIESFRKRHAEITQMMGASDFFSDQRRSAALSREHRSISGVIELHERLTKALSAIEDSQAMIADAGTDPELAELARAELAEAEAAAPALREQLLLAMLPPELVDARNTVVEVRAGAGGDEASLFVGSLYRMYTRYAEIKGWNVEVLSTSPSECGGFKEVSFLITGEEVYKALRWESGVHRVQRVPATEASGRIHTSTATVAVLPEAEEVDVQIDPSELEISVARASGPGGQGVNTTDSAVQILHKPTGLIVKCADERSQLKNKAKALKVLRARLLERKQEEEEAKYAAQRRGQIGTGDRSERIRTYNFPQSRLTDHRIGYTSHNLAGILEGELEELSQTLVREHQALRLKEMLEKDSA